MTMIRTFSAATVTSLLMGSTAFAGTLADPIVETAPAPAVTPVITGTDWTGAYGGLNLGYGDVDATGDLDGDDVTYGVHFGYDYDFGDYVLGAEIEYDDADIDLGSGVNTESVTRLKMRAGYDLGRTLVYGTAGAAYLESSVGDQTGAFIGVGAAYQATDSITVGAELLGHRFIDIGDTDVDADATTFNLRASYRF